MIDVFILILALLVFVLVFAVVVRALITRQKIIGKPPVPVFYFILAKSFVVVNLSFLLMKVLGIRIYRLFAENLYVELIALLCMAIGVTVLFLSTARLNKDLVFGLSDSKDHKLQTKGIFSVSRHPFYLGFLFILFSSCLFYPNVLNILAFAGAWIIHHVIMIREERFLLSQYGEEYREYTRRVHRYITL